MQMLSIIDTFNSWITNVGDMVNNIKNAITGFFELYVDIVSMLPSPFDTILIFTSVTIVGIILFKIVGAFL